MSSTDPRPIALTMGDGAGIGPEIALAALRDPDLARRAALYGHARALALTRDHLQRQRPDLPWPALAPMEHARWLAQGTPAAPEGQVRVVDLDGLPDAARGALDALEAIPFGAHFAPFGHLQRVALLAAIDDTMAGHTAGICTAPLNKALFKLCGLPATGHTEILAERTAAPRHVMMLGGDRLRVSLVTTHLPLARVPEALTPARILGVIEVTAGELRRRWGIAWPKIAVAALNPHAGESGTMGREDAEVIAPAVARAQEAGIDADGPWPADTLFARAAPGRPWPYDAVVCMYHDQGLIPLKLLHFGDSANITLGLPIVRTSVDHGTAYDIAGRGVADVGSMRYALALAAKLAAT